MVTGWSVPFCYIVSVNLLVGKGSVIIFRSGHRRVLAYLTRVILPVRKYADFNAQCRAQKRAQKVKHPWQTASNRGDDDCRRKLRIFDDVRNTIRGTARSVDAIHIRAYYGWMPSTNPQ